MLSSELMKTIEHSLSTFIGMKHISPTFMYHTNVFEADNIYKKPPPNEISPIFFAIFISFWVSTHDSANCWSAHRPPAARDSFNHVQDWCKAVGGIGGVPPKHKFLATPLVQ